MSFELYINMLICVNTSKLTMSLKESPNVYRISLSVNSGGRGFVFKALSDMLCINITSEMHFTKCLQHSIATPVIYIPYLNLIAHSIVSSKTSVSSLTCDLTVFL